MSGMPKPPIMRPLTEEEEYKKEERRIAQLNRGTAGKGALGQIGVVIERLKDLEKREIIIDWDYEYTHGERAKFFVTLQNNSELEFNQEQAMLFYVGCLTSICKYNNNFTALANREFHRFYSDEYKAEIREKNGE